MTTSPSTVLNQYQTLMAQAFPDPSDVTDGLAPNTWFASLRGYLSLLSWTGVVVSIGSTHRLGITAHQVSLHHIDSQSVVAIAIDAGLVLFNHESVGQDGSRMIRDVIAQLIDESVPVTKIQILGSSKSAETLGFAGLLRVTHSCLADFHAHGQQPNHHAHVVIAPHVIEIDRIRQHVTQLQARFTYATSPTPVVMPTPILIDVKPEDSDTDMDVSFIFEKNNMVPPPLQTPETDASPGRDRPTHYPLTIPVELDVVQTRLAGKQTIRTPAPSFEIEFPDPVITDEPRHTE